MNEPCKNIGCNDNDDGRCMTIACGGADKDGSVSEHERKDEAMTDAADWPTKGVASSAADATTPTTRREK